MAFFKSGMIDKCPSNVTAKPCPLNGGPKAEQAGVNHREAGHQDPQPQIRVSRMPGDEYQHQGQKPPLHDPKSSTQVPEFPGQRQGSEVEPGHLGCQGTR